MNPINVWRLLILLLTVVLSSCNSTTKPDLTGKPNILLIYSDDLGYGDSGCYNPESKIPTPNIDKLAQEGIRFTNAHTAAAICGPSRYGLMTGRYPWRRGVGGADNGAKFRDLFVEPGRTTIASLLKEQGYNTAQIGKWGV